ncbi:MAG: NAD(P)H-hydrate dehydratase [Oligoflexia bacterium]|nr:NAD(P)H-hydrate dehydratase [Oligoflexia bacterium]
MRVVTAKEMRDIDDLAQEKFKIPSIVLMENAGLKAAEIVASKYSELGFLSEILVFAGKGKNGGDALVVARQLVAMGKKVRLFLLHSFDAYKGESKQNLEILLEQKIRPIVLDNVSPLEEYFNSANGPFLCVDGLLGIGFKGPLAGLFADVVDLLNAKSDYMIALDIPTGVDATTGQVVGQAIYADLTIAFGFSKLGHFVAPGAINRGELTVVDISLPTIFRSDGYIHALSKDTVAPLLKRRDRYGHKNSFGHTLLFGGSRGKLGAISMAASACLRVGTGLVTVVTWQEVYEQLSAKLADEIMCLPLEVEEAKYDQYKDLVHYYSSVVIGPGMGTDERAEKLLCDFIDFYKGTLLIDADGISMLAKPNVKERLFKRKEVTILTPHPGELSRLLAVPKSEVVSSPREMVERASEEANAIVVLKGATSFICAGDGHIYLNHYPNDGMATAGSGDVLAGMIGGLAGQSNINPKDAVCLGVYMHSLAGDKAAQKLGHRSMAASDLISHLGESFLELRKHREFLLS